MSTLTKEIIASILNGAIERGEHAVVETEALRLERETMRIQAERIRCLEDELAEARAEIKRLSGELDVAATLIEHAP